MNLIPPWQLYRCLCRSLVIVVGAIGAISSLTDVVSDGKDIGIHNGIVAEHSRYDGRHITELSGQWLEKYGESPFFFICIIIQWTIRSNLPLQI